MRNERGRLARSGAWRHGVVFAGLCCLLLAGAGASSARIAATNVTVIVLTPGGKVRSTPAGIDCPGTCSAVLNEPVTLTAVPDENWKFQRWEADCETANGPTCTTSSAAITASVAFVPRSVLQISVTGSGRVTSSPAGIDPATGKAASASCNALTRLPNDPAPPQADKLCMIGYRPGQKVTLTAQGIGGLAQKTWSRYHCQVGKPCTVRMDEPGTTVGATFAGALLGVVVQGGGRVTSAPAGIDCGSTCVAGFATGTKVRLTATPGGDPFIEWFGSCGTAVVCDVTMNDTDIVAAGFGSPVTMIIPRLLESADVGVDVGGLGTGSVAVSGPESGATTCQAPHCTKRFKVPELVKLTAAPGAGGSRFLRWLGGCPPNAPTCEFDTRFITSVAACFVPLAPRDELGVVRVVKANGKRRLAVAVRPGSKAAKVAFRLVRPGKSLALPVAQPPSLPRTVSFVLPKSLKRGTYTVRTAVTDTVGCQSDLKARQVVVPRA